MSKFSISSFACREREIGATNPAEKLRLIDHRLGTLEASWRHSIPFKTRTHAGTSAMEFDNAENRFLICGNSQGEVSIVDFESSTNRNPAVESYPLNHRVIPTRSRHQFMVNGCQWYPVDTSVFITTGMDKLLKLWDASQALSIEDFKFAQPVSNFHWHVSKSNSLIAVATSSSNVSLLDPRLGSTAQQIRSKCQRIWSVQWIPSENYILSTGSDQGAIALWDIRSGKNELKRVQASAGIEETNSKTNGNGKRPLPNSLAHLNRISCLRCSSDGRFLVSQTHSRIISLWEANSLRLLTWIKLPEPDSQISTIPLKFELCDEGRSLWAFVPMGNQISVVPFPHPLRTDGKQANAGRNGGCCIRSLQGHFQNVTACAYRRVHQQLVTSSTDRLNLIWAPRMDECQFDSAAQHIQHLHEDAFSDED